MPGLLLGHAYPGLLARRDADELTRIFQGVGRHDARQIVVRANTPIFQSAFLAQGFVGRYRHDGKSRGRLVALQIPGDFVDLPSFYLGHLDHDLVSLTPTVLRLAPHSAVEHLHHAAPAVEQALLRIMLMEAGIHRYWTYRLSGLRGRARLANLFAEIFLRQFSRGLCQGLRCAMPLTQADIGDACAMTAVHVNRMLGELRDEGLCTLYNGSLTIHDLAALIRTGKFDHDYLYLPPDAEAAFAELAAPRRRPRGRS
ncbi:Crp/Fnr family transcriptional regulator [Paracoccus sp. p4-l81]|uniref:Crp/Fnr family transcriptional regulator n=1 Tax=Paracoccus sp. p4-l81 TaxID=3342806 RepID=UPI0035B87E39